jgi:hypothetical protein
MISVALVGLAGLVLLFFLGFLTGQTAETRSNRERRARQAAAQREINERSRALQARDDYGDYLVLVRQPAYVGSNVDDDD